MNELQPVFELRPLSMGEILDRTFALYRRRFWLFVGLSAIAAMITTLGTFVQLTLGLKGRAPLAGDPSSVARFGAEYLGVTFLILLVHLLAYSIVQAATVSAVEASYLGRETSIGAAFATTKRIWYRYILIALWQGWSLGWPMLAILVPAAILAGVAGVAGGGGAKGAVIAGVLVLVLFIPAIVLGFIFYLRNSLGIVACVSEQLTVRQAMRRSKFLVADNKGRLFLLYLLLLALSIAVGMVQYFFNLFLLTSSGSMRVLLEISTLLVTFLTGALVQPVGAISFVLFYLDQRVRKEGFDVEQLLERVTGVAPPPREVESPFGSVYAMESLTGFPSTSAQDGPFSQPLPGSVPPPLPAPETIWPPRSPDTHG